MMESATLLNHLKPEEAAESIEEIGEWLGSMRKWVESLETERLQVRRWVCADFGDTNGLWIQGFSGG